MFYSWSLQAVSMICLRALAVHILHSCGRKFLFHLLLLSFLRSITSTRPPNIGRPEVQSVRHLQLLVPWVGSVRRSHHFTTSVVCCMAFSIDLA